MRYTTTRGNAPGTFSAAEVVTLGVPPGQGQGLFVPESIPRCTLADVRRLSWPDMAAEIFALFISPSECPEIKDIVRGVFATQVPAPPVVELTSGLSIVELFHGRSLAFKDIAVAPAATLLAYFLAKAPSASTSKQATVLVATSGDTGPAVLAACQDTPLRCLCLFPQGRVARRQALQMTSHRRANHMSVVYQVSNATSDDLDRVLSSVFADADLRERHQLCALNSLNFARIIGQIVIFYWARMVCPKFRTIVVPTGAMGNMTAGLLAQRMGLDIELICANNANNAGGLIFDTLELNWRHPVTPTLSPAMDIACPYNVERIVWLTQGAHSASAFMHQVETLGSARLNGRIDGVRTGSCSDAETVSAMRRAQELFGYSMDPHTAVGVAAASRCLGRDMLDEAGKEDEGGKEGGLVVLSTASPLKFDEAMAAALGQPLAPMDALESFAVKVPLDKLEDVLRRELESPGSSFL